MPSPPKNTGCGPTNVFGGFDQTLFLGASVMSFSASAGWNEQVSEITVQVVEDTCEGNKVYFDTSLTEQTWTAADPGFVGETYPIIGAPVYFRVGDFEFSGLIQNWDEINSESGNPAYEIKVVDPRAILENGQVIIGEFSGSVGPIYNIINAYGFMESFGFPCPQYYQAAPGVYFPGDVPPDGAVFGSPALGFGGANANHNGMQWNQILAASRALLSAFPPIVNQWSPYGRLAFKAPVDVGDGMGLMPADLITGLAYYYIDLNEVPNAPSYWRLNGTNTSLMDAISQICQDSGHDYYVELVPVVGGILGAGIHKFIKVRTANRSAAPALNSIDTFVGNAGREVVRFRKGRELRNEVTSSFVIGGPKQSFYQAEQNEDPEGDDNPDPPEADDTIIPFFGLHPSTGDAYIPTKDDNGWWEVEIATNDLAFQLAAPKYEKAIASSVVISEKELLVAESGFDVWMSYASIYNTELWQTLDLAIGGIWDINHIVQILVNIVNQLGDNELRPADFHAIRAGVFQPHQNGNLDFEIAQIAHAWLQKITSTYYGKQYQVRVPYTCVKADPESDIIITSEEPTDGGWTEVTPVLQLAHPSVATDFFSLDDNRLGAFCRFDGANGLELSNLDLNDVITLEEESKAWVKLSVEPSYVYMDKSTFFIPRAVVSLPQVVNEVGEEVDFQRVQVGLRDLLAKLGEEGKIDEEQANEVVRKIQTGIANVLTHIAVNGRAIMPNACGFGIKSNVLTYGPWGEAGPAGGVNVVNDEGLVPWEYGGFDTLELAGLSIASEGTTDQQVTEAGEITVAGYPELPLGAELLAADTGGPFNGGGNNLVENRSVASGSAGGGTYYFAPVFAWSGTFGPNVTGLTTRVGPDGLETTYNLKTWTPKFGKFAKGNAERIKQVGQQRLRFQKQIRAFAQHRFNINKLNTFKKAADREAINLKNAGAFGQAQTPHEVFVGKLTNWNSDYRRPTIATESVKELPIELADDYTRKAVMSLDGLIRPVSMDGSGSLPRYANPEDHCQKTISVGTQPPVDKIGEAGDFAQYNQDIDILYLNPFANPTSKNRNEPVTRSDTPTIGHDIEIIGRGTNIPQSSVIMPIQGFANTTGLQDSDYADDYRMLALRGPLLIHGWGYDLDGFPVPNKADTEAAASGGNFTETSLECKFMDDWLRKSHTWPLGPVDLRWDRKRSVWTAPVLRSVVGYLTTGLTAFSTGTARQTSGPTKYDCEGASFDAEFVVWDRVGRTLSSGDFIVAEYDPQACQYQVIEAPISSGSVPFTFVDSNCCLTPAAGYPRPTLTVPFTANIVNFGAGLWLHRAVVSGNTCDISVPPTNLLHVFAGFHPLNTSTGCSTFFETQPLTDDGTRFINVVDFMHGLQVVDGPNDCDLLVRSGIISTSGGDCFNGQAEVPLAHNILWERGLKIREGDDNCTLRVGLDYRIITENVGNPGFGTTGLRFGECFTMSDFNVTTCVATIDLAQTFSFVQDPEPAGIFEIVVPTGGNATCCYPSGCTNQGGMHVIQFTGIKLKFNECGQLVGAISGENAFTVACPTNP